MNWSTAAFTCPPVGPDGPVGAAGWARLWNSTPSELVSVGPYPTCPPKYVKTRLSCGYEPVLAVAEAAIYTGSAESRPPPSGTVTRLPCTTRDPPFLNWVSSLDAKGKFSNWF